jgi:hypothetical protein
MVPNFRLTAMQVGAMIADSMMQQGLLLVSRALTVVVSTVVVLRASRQAC